MLNHDRLELATVTDQNISDVDHSDNDINYILTKILSPTDLQSLINHAEMGYVRGLLNTVETIEQQEPRALPLTQLLRQHAIHFQFPALLQLLKQGEHV
jgi:hypothetical protein